ncbi:hypothetical protein M3B43_08480 [Nesterenkonia massiliensis]|uniref:Peptide chain release factor 1 n=1 Tax=Nesterenkonia massiliensis TaxID=1232429 RepID=A0ABT2HRR9_9MICC|nr:hypothetical protein [Nesterenkonia massiliensis]MCT1607361.1 hypothetical protein [Nesterenkonia massiliensis]
MQLADLRHIYDAEGPFATVYLQAGEASADAEQQVRLRWDQLRSQLADAGADDQAIDAIDQALSAGKAQAVQSEGRVLVANREGLLLEENFDAAHGAGDLAVVGPLPQLGNYIRERARSLRMLVAIADQEGAVLRRVVMTSSEVHETGPESSVEGSAVESVHKPRGNALSHRQIQNTADEAAKQNIRDVVASVTKAAKSWKPDVLVLAGETQGRKLLHEQLPADLQSIAREVESGGGIPSGSADEGGERALQEDLEALARTLTIEKARAQTDRYQESKAGNLTVEGAEDIRRAAQLGAIDTLLLRYDQQADDEEQLLYAAASVDAAVALVGTSITDHAAAILRYEAPVDQMDVNP